MRCPDCGSEMNSAGCTTPNRHPPALTVPMLLVRRPDVLLPDEVRALRSRAELAEAEVERLKVYEPRINNGAWQADVESRTTPEFREHFAVSLAQIMVGANAPNYVEMHVVDPRDGRRFTVTIQRAEGKTPGQLKDEAVKERELAEARLEDAAKVSPMCADNLRLRERAEKAEAEVADCLGYIDAVIEDRDQYENECYVAEAQAERLAEALRSLQDDVVAESCEEGARPWTNHRIAILERVTAVLSEYQGRQMPGEGRP